MYDLITRRVKPSENIDEIVTQRQNVVLLELTLFNVALAVPLPNGSIRPVGTVYPAVGVLRNVLQASIFTLLSHKVAVFNTGHRPRGRHRKTQ